MKNELCDVTTIFAYGGLEETICIIWAFAINAYKTD
jgi:hypothetical protein